MKWSRFIKWKWCVENLNFEWLGEVHEDYVLDAQSKLLSQVYDDSIESNASSLCESENYYYNLNPRIDPFVCNYKE